MAQGHDEVDDQRDGPGRRDGPQGNGPIEVTDDEGEDSEHGGGDGESQQMPQPLPALAGGVGPPGTRWAYRCGPTRANGG